MFGEYAQIATYLPSSRDSSGAGDFPTGSLPPHLLPPPSVSQPLWAGAKVSRRGRGQEVKEDRSSSLEDFIMVAEFSEIEGPKPVVSFCCCCRLCYDGREKSVCVLSKRLKH